MNDGLTNAAAGHLQALEGILPAFQQQDPQRLAERSGAAFTAVGSSGVFHLKYLGDEMEICFPTGEAVNKTAGGEVSAKDRIVLIKYLLNAVPVPERDEWKTFKELSAAPHHWNVLIPEAIEALTKGFGNDLKAFEQAALRLEGEPVKLGDRGYRYYVLPRIPIQIGIWEADEEFPPKASILFNAAAQLQADTATLFSLGIALVRKLLYLAGKRSGP
ncbi:MAG: DUF3786 domain-containing protein [Clostridia bacterium]|nr:DUF3786 domain-containing protein [Clostridia bacterium]